MATQVSTDILEEDAADLQFPKDTGFNIDVEDWFMSDTGVESSEICTTCKKEINCEPFIICKECNIIVCVDCYSQGLETLSHENSHSFKLETKLCPVFLTSDWSKEEELELLDAVLEYGYGNWVDIAKRVLRRSPEEIEFHYNRFYVDNIEKLNDLPDLPLRCCYQTSAYNNAYNTAVSEEPPRFPFGSPQSKFFAGYNAARGDFDIEYDNAAEHIVSGVKFESNESEDANLDTEIQYALVSSYNEKLKERYRRKKIVRDHGLLLLRKCTMLLARYECQLSKNISKFNPFMQLLSSDEFTCLLEGLNHELLLKKYFIKLKIFRSNGLTRFFSCKLFEKLNLIREDALRELNLTRENPNLVFQSLHAKNMDIKPVFIPKVGNAPRKRPPPLNIVMLPGYEKLNNEERDLCSEWRIVPESYLNFKEILINESIKNNGIRLATARQLIKIDVNKTRKVYNLLSDMNLIKKL